MTKLRKLMTAAAIFATSGALADDLPVRSYLTLDLAQQMVNACLAHQTQNAYAPINVFVVDDAGVVLAAARQDGACKSCGAVAHMKATNSATSGYATRQIELLAYGENKDGVGAVLPGAPHIPGNVAFPGGLPVVDAANNIVGGIGVSGAYADQDELCAQAGVDAIAAYLD